MAKWMVAAAGLAMLAGCVVNEAAPPPRGVVVNGPPPPPVAEQRPTPPPQPQSIWVAGYWHWTGMQYSWIPGHWENAPPGDTWNAPRYGVHDGRYFYEPGGWKHR